MKLYFSPLACSLAPHIASLELELPLERVQVDRRLQRAADGSDYRRVTPLGMVPVLVLPDGDCLYENAAILQYLAALRPDKGLLPEEPRARAGVRQWLSFVGTELHKAVYSPLLDEDAPDAARDEALRKAPARLAFAAQALAEREYLVDRFSVADAYLFTVLFWSQATPLALGDYPPLAAYVERSMTRPSVAAAVREELELRRDELLRRQALPGARSTRWLMAAFNRVFLERDPDALPTLVADDCVIENSDGTRHVGREACVALWRSVALDPALRFELEETRVERERALITWTLVRGGTRIQGVNRMSVREGRIIGARGYLRADPRGADGSGRARGHDITANEGEL